MLRYFQIGENLSIPSYNLFVGIGIAVAMVYLQYEKQFSLLDADKKNAIHLGLLLSIMMGFVGAFTFEAYTQGTPLNWHNLNQIGLTFLGGVTVGILTLTIFLKLKSIAVLRTLNLLTPAFCLSHILGRVGCFFAGCCFGSPTNLSFGVQFPEHSLAHDHFMKNVHVHPTQLYESFFIFIVFLTVRKPEIKSKFLIYLFSYSVFRFFIEFIRADNRGTIFNQSILTPSQFISLAAAIVIIAFTARQKLKSYNL